MILSDTVFVLGAGASMPYGFPSGAELGQLVSNSIEQDPNGQLPMVLRSNRINGDLLQAFPKAFRGSTRESLDQFLDTPRGHDFLGLAKMAMVLVLAEREKEKRLIDAKNGDWMGYLFNRILGSDPDAFRKNRLKVITFNFDRSFERRMFLAVQGNYSLTGEQSAELCFESMPVLHIHGDLGQPSWAPSRAGVIEARRGYEPFSEQVLDADLQMFADRIKVIHEEIAGDTVAQAREWVREAHRVCFIGFGYHNTSLKRLGVSELFSLARRPEFIGTCVGLEGGELAPVMRTFQGQLNRYACEALPFLRQTEIVHDQI